MLAAIQYVSSFSCPVSVYVDMAQGSQRGKQDMANLGLLSTRSICQQHFPFSSFRREPWQPPPPTLQALCEDSATSRQFALSGRHRRGPRHGERWGAGAGPVMELCPSHLQGPRNGLTARTLLAERKGSIRVMVGRSS